MQKHLDMRTQHKTAINSGTQANAPEMRLRMMVLASTQQRHKNCFFSTEIVLASTFLILVILIFVAWVFARYNCSPDIYSLLQVHYSPMWENLCEETILSSKLSLSFRYSLQTMQISKLCKMLYKVVKVVHPMSRHYFGWHNKINKANLQTVKASKQGNSLNSPNPVHGPHPRPT